MFPVQHLSLSCISGKCASYIGVIGHTIVLSLDTLWTEGEICCGQKVADLDDTIVARLHINGCFTDELYIHCCYINWFNWMDLVGGNVGCCFGFCLHSELSLWPCIVAVVISCGDVRFQCTCSLRSLAILNCQEMLSWSPAPSLLFFSVQW